MQAKVDVFLEKNEDGLVRIKDNQGTTRLVSLGYVLCNDMSKEDMISFPTEEDKVEWDKSKEKKEQEEKAKSQNGRWIPDISDKDNVKKGTGVLITRAKEEYRKRFNDSPLKSMKDSIGVYAYVYEDKVLVAKKYINGWIVSAHKKAVEFAYKEEKAFVMYIGDSNAFYKFDTEKIMQKSRLNHKNGVPMLNFDIKLGMNIERRYYLSDMTKKDGSNQMTLG